MRSRLTLGTEGTPWRAVAPEGSGIVPLLSPGNRTQLECTLVSFAPVLPAHQEAALTSVEALVSSD
jgi:hypothetical protein